MPRFAFYDLDRTITRLPTYSAFLLFAARQRSPLRLTLVPLVLPGAIAYRLGLLTRDRLKEIMHALLLGRSTSASSIATIAEAFADRVVARNIRPGARARIRQDLAEGYRVVLATAAHRFYAEAIASRLGIADVVATAAAASDGSLSHRLDGSNLYGAAKAAAVKQWLATIGASADTSRIRVYTDHVSDAPLLEFADEPFAVNPHGRLRRLALARGWTILDWQAEGERGVNVTKRGDRATEAGATACAP